MNVDKGNIETAMKDTLSRGPVDHPVLDHEMMPVLPFTEYRQWCDSVDDFRKIGVQDSESYSQVLNDSRTVFMEHEGGRVPVLVPIEYEKMYKLSRCRELTGSNNVMLLSIPVETLDVFDYSDATSIELPDDTAVVVEEFVSADQPQSSRTIPRIFAEKFKAIEFVNPDLSMYAGHETAWMEGYSFIAEPVEGKSRDCDGETLADDFMAAWQSIAKERGVEVVPSSSTQEGTFLLSARVLSENPQIVDDLWAISEVGFGDVLGAHHPVSMEFSKDFFDQQIVSENTVTVVHYTEGKPICFGFLALDMNNNDWLNVESGVIQNEIEGAKVSKQAHVHFLELISGGAKGMGYSSQILQLYFNIANRTGYEYRVFFESTNLSSLYVPPIITDEASKSNKMEITSPIQAIGRLSYWGMVAK